MGVGGDGVGIGSEKLGIASLAGTNKQTNKWAITNTSNSVEHVSNHNVKVNAEALLCFVLSATMARETIPCSLLD